MIIRVVSAVVAAAILLATYLLFHIDGLIAICSLAVVGCIHEFSRLTLLRASAPFLLRAAFFLLALGLFATTVWMESLAVPMATVAVIFFLTMALTGIHSADDVQKAFEFQGLAVLGFAYVALFPGLGMRLLLLAHGPAWFLAFLLIVFSGDTFAFLAGSAFGKTKLMEPVSPKKTVEGSIGGLVGSAVAGACMAKFSPLGISLGTMVLVALVTGAFAQVGDLFESLLKRIADVKDSGSIMPGHGGILDRIDGVIFAAPIYYILVHFLT